MIVNPYKQDIEDVLFKPTKDSILLVDQNGLVQYSNSKVTNTFGYNRNAMFNQKIALLFPIKYFSVINTYIYRCANSTNFISNKFFKNLFGLKKSGVIFPIEISVNQYIYKNKKMVLLRVIDKTSRTTLKEEKLKKHLLKEKTKKKEQAQFVSKTSHELRTPLTTILNATAILDKLKGSFGYEDMQTKNINRIKTSITQLTEVLNDFLAINKISDNKNSINLDTNVQTFSKEIIENLESGNTKNTIIKYNHIGNNYAKVDRDMLSSIFNNLLSNAIKYSPNKSVILFNTNITNDILTVTCKDKGIGIPKEEQDKLFKRYYRANNALNIQGTGLGLSIIKEYLDKINGTISIKDNIDKGAIFTVSIPVSHITTKQNIKNI